MRCKALKPTSDSRLQDFLGTLQSFEAYTPKIPGQGPLGNGLWPIRVLVAWLDGLVEILVSVEFTGSPQSFGAYIISQATGFLRYAAKL